MSSRESSAILVETVHDEVQNPFKIDQKNRAD